MDITNTYPRFKLGYLLLSLALIAAAIFVGFNTWLSILVGSGLWLVTSASYPGLEFSADYHCMRDYYGLFGYKIGRWQRLPPIVGVTLKYHSEIVHGNEKYSWGIWGSSTTRSEELIIMLSAQNSSTGIIIARFSTNEITRAKTFAHDIAGNFNVPVNVYLSPNQLKPL